jgi:hypothetical protein
VTKKWYSFFVVTDEEARQAEAPAASTAAAAPRRVSDVVATEPIPDVSAPPAGASAAIDLAEVYEAAKIAMPPHGYSVLKVAEMLRSEHLHALAPEVKRKSIMVALDAAGVKVTDIIEDAVRRDRALDAYERVLQKHLDDLRAQVAAENQRLEDEISERVAELRARIDENIRKTTAEQDEFLAWRARKHQEEDTIAEAVSHFVAENPVTTARAAPTQGDADVR